MKRKTNSIISILFLVMVLIVSGCAGEATTTAKPSENDGQQQQGTDENSATSGEKGTEDAQDEQSEDADTSDNDATDEDAEQKEEEPADQQDEAVDAEEEEAAFSYPDAVRGVYVTGHSAGGAKVEKLLHLLDTTDLNAMVIDIKDDYGNLTYKPEPDSALAPYGKNMIKDPKALLQTLSEHEIYPIARVVVFKDSVLAEQHPDLSFLRNGQIWRNGRGEAFVNPFRKEVWEHNVAIAKEAAEMGFQEIQFDYVRFPEGFERRDKILQYDLGEYGDHEDLVKARVQAVTDFVAYAEKELEPYGVDIAVDIFGYTVTIDEAPGIGQNFTKISEHVDVISSMIYPSHWGPYNLGVPKPDLEPYKLVQNYIVKEKEKLFPMEDPPTSRPWIQDFTAPWLGSGNYKVYGKAEVEAQIRALNEAGVEEFLLWHAGNSYTPNVDYTPEINEQKRQAILIEDQKVLMELEKRRHYDEPFRQ